MTIEDLKEGLNKEIQNSPFNVLNAQIAALNLLAERIPNEVPEGIIRGATDDMIFLPDGEVAAKYLLPEDLPFLNWCGVGYDDKTESLYMFV